MEENLPLKIRYAEEIPQIATVDKAIDFIAAWIGNLMEEDEFKVESDRPPYVDQPYVRIMAGGWDSPLVYTGEAQIIMEANDRVQTLFRRICPVEQEGAPIAPGAQALLPDEDTQARDAERCDEHAREVLYELTGELVDTRADALIVFWQWIHED